MKGRVVSRGRLGREWPHAILSNRARQIDRVARQGGEGVQDALYICAFQCPPPPDGWGALEGTDMSEGACPADLAISTPLGKWLPKYVSMLRIV